MQFRSCCPKRSLLSFPFSVLQQSPRASSLLCQHQHSCVLGSAEATGGGEISPTTKTLGPSSVTFRSQRSRGRAGGWRMGDHPSPQPAENHVKTMCLEPGRVLGSTGVRGRPRQPTQPAAQGESKGCVLFPLPCRLIQLKREICWGTSPSETVCTV